MTALGLALVPLLALRALAAAAEVVVADGPGLRRWPRLLSDQTLAAAARATVPITSAAIVGVVVSLLFACGLPIIVPLVLGLVVLPVTLVLLDVVPRGLAADAPLATWRALEPFLGAMALVLSPLLLAERALSRALLGRRQPAAPLVSLRRLGGWLAARPARGALDVSEAGLIARIARFTGRTARDACVPLVDVCAVPDDATIEDVVGLVRERGFSRIPVFHEAAFNVLGVVSSLDLLGEPDGGRPVTAVMREPLFVPESKPLPELLAALQAEGRNLAVVVDEYGGAVGLVTVEDLVEEIVGEIEDEYDVPREHFRRVAPGVFLVSARAAVAEVNERFGWNLPQGEYETVGGLVLERLGRVPKPGDSLRAGRVRIEVARASPRAVRELRVQEVGVLNRRGRVELG